LDRSGDPERPVPTPESQVQLNWQPQAPEEKWLRFEVFGLAESHFMKSPFPPFTIRLVQRNGDGIQRPSDPDGKSQPILDMRVRLVVRNKWAEVTSEVLPRSNPIRVLVDGEVTVSDWNFQDISHKHGGFFTVHVLPVDFADEVLDWASIRITILSDKVHAKLKRTQGKSSSS
jgi:hypothetical protein